MKIILDTNMVMTVYQFKVDIFAEATRLDPGASLFVADATIRELEKTAEKKDAAARAAKLGLLLLKEKGVTVLKTPGNGSVDSQILGLAKEGYAVATQDRAFKDRLRKAGIPVIVLRKKQFLAVES